MSSCDITRSVSVKASPQLGKQLATNNHALVLADPIGARCYHCLGKPKITVTTPTCDGSTVFCPLCRIDAIVPASQIPHPIERNLKYWNTYWFSTDFFISFLLSLRLISSLVNSIMLVISNISDAFSS